MTSMPATENIIEITYLIAPRSSSFR